MKTPAEAIGYTSLGSGGGDASLPQRDRHEHATKLLANLNAALYACETRQKAVRSTRNGFYLEFESATGFSLQLKSLEDRNSGIRLLNVRTTGDIGNKVQLATIYVPKIKTAFFLKKIEDRWFLENKQQ